MFGSTKSEPIDVGGSLIEESPETEFLGITFNKRLTWKTHTDKLEVKLRTRIGQLRRLSWHLPKETVIKMIESIFMSKVRYALELLVDVTSVEHDMVLKRLHALHRQAMKAALGMGRKTDISDEKLLQATGQSSVLCCALSATARMAWKCGGNWESHPLTTGNRIDKHISGRATRQTLQEFPPQKTKASIINRVLEVWKVLPEAIKTEKDETAAKVLIKSWAKKQSN